MRGRDGFKCPPACDDGVKELPIDVSRFDGDTEISTE